MARITLPPLLLCRPGLTRAHPPGRRDRLTEVAEAYAWVADKRTGLHPSHHVEAVLPEKKASFVKRCPLSIHFSMEISHARLPNAREAAEEGVVDYRSLLTPTALMVPVLVAEEASAHATLEILILYRKFRRRCEAVGNTPSRLL